MKLVGRNGGDTLTHADAKGHSLEADVDGIRATTGCKFTSMSIYLSLYLNLKQAMHGEETT